MYNPSRGGVRGGADQFTWESVKADKHRENYLGHSLMAPVGRWQKGKDLSWYAKERKGDKTLEAMEKSELASVKKAEEEAMLIALGHNIVRKTQSLTKEDMREALKRNTERDDHHIERIDGVGAASQRIASLSGTRKDGRQNNEGVAFETVRQRNDSENNDKRNEYMLEERKKSKKKSKKHKKEKKHKKNHKESLNSGSSDDSSKYKTKYKKSKSDDADKKSFKEKNSRISEHRRLDYSCSDSPDYDDRKSSKLKNHKTPMSKGRDHVDFYSSDSEDKRPLKIKSHKKSKSRHQDYSSDSPASIPQTKTKHKRSKLDSSDKKSSKEKTHKKSKLQHKDYSSDENSHSDSRERDNKRHKKQKEFVKRCRHDTSESD